MLQIFTFLFFIMSPQGDESTMTQVVTDEWR